MDGDAKTLPEPSGLNTASIQLSSSTLLSQVSTSTFSPGARSHTGIAIDASVSGTADQIDGGLHSARSLALAAVTRCRLSTLPWHSQSLSSGSPGVRAQWPSMLEVTLKQPWRQPAFDPHLARRSYPAWGVPARYA